MRRSVRLSFGDADGARTSRTAWWYAVSSRTGTCRKAYAAASKNPEPMPSTDRIPPDRRTTDVVGDRIVAQIVDLIVQFVQLVVVAVLLAVLVRPGTEEGARALAFPAMLSLPLYGGLLEGYWNGQTVGKRMVGIRVVDDRGREPSVGQAILRNVPAIVLFSWLTTAVALALIAMDDRRQRLFDDVAGTFVVGDRPVHAHRTGSH